ncbi:MAG: DUF1150 domain-containing protein [Pseudomonadota bacterium]
MTRNDNASGATPRRINLAALGADTIAYVRPIRSEQVHDLFPQAPEIEPGLQLFALHKADGEPILLTDNRDAVLAEAERNDLTLVSLH